MEIDYYQFQDLLGQKNLILAAIGAPNCPYSRRMYRLCRQIARQYAPPLTVVTLKESAASAIAAAQGLELLPALVLYCRGRALGTLFLPDSLSAVDRFLHYTLSGSVYEKEILL